MDTRPSYIILAEEDPGFAKEVCKSFELPAYACKIEIVESLDQARNLMEERPPDLIIIEWRQPGGHGIRTAEAARFADKRPLLILSEPGDIAEVNRFNHPAANFIIKTPETIQALPAFAEQTIRNWRHYQKSIPETGLTALIENDWKKLQTFDQRDVDYESGLIEHALETAVLITNSQFGFIHIADLKKNVIKLHVWSETCLKQRPDWENPENASSPSFLWTDCIRRKHPVIENDRPEKGSRNGQKSNPGLNIGRFMSIPASIPGRFVSILGVIGKKTPYTDTDFFKALNFINMVHGKLRSDRTRGYLQKTRRALKILSEFNHSLISTPDETDFLNSICKNIVQFGGYRMVWIGYADHDEAKTVRPAASYGVENGYLESVNVTWNDDEYGQGPTGKSIRTGKPVISRYIQEDPDFRPWREEAEKRGYCSSISVPMMDKHVPLGSINIYASEPDAFDDEEIALLANLATDIVFGVQTIKSKIDRQTAEKEKKKLESFLRQAQKMEAIGTLAGGVAHDFNNILSVIMGYGEMIKDDLEDSGIQTLDIDNILNACYRAKELVNQILMFSRQAEQESQPVHLSHIIKEALKLLRPSIPATIEFKQKIDSSCGPVLADPTQIHQIVMNLCANAYHAMKDAGGVLEITLSQLSVNREENIIGMELMSGEFVKLIVSDTGHGMSRAVMERIFDPYFTTKGRKEGTGLGLSVVHGIIKSLGGFIHVYSEIGKGSTFQVFLPMIENEKIEEEIQEAVIPEGQERILIVDDEKNLADLLGRMLNRLGYTVSVFEDSNKALNEFQNQPDAFDLVITDMAMPKLNGLELSQRMLQERPSLPIILCTGYSEIINEEKAQEVGISQFIMKPIIKSVLAKAVRAAVDK